jgi:hypothetical protein
MAFVIHLVTYAQSLIGADPIVIPELTAVIGDDFFPQFPLQERLKVNVQEHTGFLIRRHQSPRNVESEQTCFCCAMATDMGSASGGFREGAIPQPNVMSRG